MKVLAHHPKDIYLALIAVANVALLAYGTVTVGHIPIAASVAIGVGLVLLTCTNYQCTAHNFLHNPFFSSEALNRAFSMLNSLVLGVSQALYRHHHMHHHKYNNDAKDPETGTTKDMTSTWRHGRSADEEENIFLYTFIGFFRTDFGELLAMAKKKGDTAQVWQEHAALAAFVGVLAYFNWVGALTFYLPVWYLGHCAALWENYLEHHGSIPGNRKTDSVSCYNGFYIWIWFNNGYHQEHHWRPQVHWTEVPAIRAQLPGGESRRICSGAHWFNFFPPPLSSYTKVEEPKSVA